MDDFKIISSYEKVIEEKMCIVCESQEDIELFEMWLKKSANTRLIAHELRGQVHRKEFPLPGIVLEKMGDRFITRLVSVQEYRDDRLVKMHQLITEIIAEPEVKKPPKTISVKVSPTGNYRTLLCSSIVSVGELPYSGCCQIKLSTGESMAVHFSDWELKKALGWL